MIDSDIMVGTGLRITASRDELMQKLALVSRGVSTRTAVLVLAGIQLRAEAGRLHLAATDMDVHAGHCVNFRDRAPEHARCDRELLHEVARDEERCRRCGGIHRRHRVH